MGKPYVRLDKDKAAVLLVDHQTGLLSLVRDIDPDKFKNNVLALAAAAKYFNLPTILTTSFEQGPNGPLVPELKEMFPDAPYIARPGQINAWDNADFVKAVKATGRTQLIIAGVCFRHIQPPDPRRRLGPHEQRRRAADVMVRRSL